MFLLLMREEYQGFFALNLINIARYVLKKYDLHNVISAPIYCLIVFMANYIFSPSLKSNIDRCRLKNI